MKTKEIYVPAAGSPFTLTSSWQKVFTTATRTRGLHIVPIATAQIFDIEYYVVAAGAAAPSNSLRGTPIWGGETFDTELPVGDIYLKSDTAQTALVFKV